MSQKLIEACESEALNLSGQIQSHGALLYVTPEQIISHCSENIGKYIPAQPDILIGRSLPQYLKKLVAEHNAPVGKHSLKPLHLDNWHECDLNICTNDDGSLVLELFHTDVAQSETYPAPQLLACINNDQELKQLQNDLVSWIAEVTGHERSMYYQFVEDGDGHVTEEFCTNNANGSYLDLRFPASDIPRIARTLYLKNPWRMIPDAAAASINLIGMETPPDLTYSDLRSVSPIHQIYMANMGVGSSISFPIVRNGELDALISCHSSKSHWISRESLSRIYSVLADYTTLLKDYDLRLRMQVIDEFNLKHTQLRLLLDQPTSIEDRWAAVAAEIRHNFAADGVTLCTPTTTLTFGLSPDLEALSQINHWFDNQESELVAHTQHLSESIPELNLCEASGMCAIRFRYPGNNRIQLSLFLFREEYIHEVTWGGNPNKPIESHDGTYGISPRQSFSKWVEKRLGHSRPWPNTIRLELLRLRTILEQGQYSIESE